ncbi:MULTISPECIES: hypothetical protein [unclassified Kitasatospora]|uniref:hypothetical protein n=1 Tax=unclassified Kitasatospora TaxID=2633591 RepID=UPI00340880ED
MSADVDAGKDLWIGLGLAEAAAEAKVGPAPVADIVAGGHRRRHRRRTVVGAVALASVAALTGGVLAQLHPGPAATQHVAPAGIGVPAGTGAVGTGAAGTGAAGESATVPTAGAATPGARDPFTPVRVRLGQGVANGKTWEIWQALWPAAPKERAYEQALAVWQERTPFDSTVPKPTPEYVAQYWDPDSDVINTYFTVDGVRLGHDAEGSTPSPGKLDPRERTVHGGGLFGRSSKDGIVPPADVVTLSIGPDVGRVLVTWADGTTTEPQPVTVGDSPTRRMVVARPGTMRATSWQFFDKNGNKLPDEGAKYLTEPAS